MKIPKLIILAILLIPIVPLFAANNFVVSSDIIIADVTFGNTTADMIIFSGSTAEGISFDAGVFTVTNPGSDFRVGSSDSTVKSIQISKNGSVVICSENLIAGTSYATLATDAGSYIARPSSTTDCGELCTILSNASTYNAYPGCGAATCNTGYNLVNGACEMSGGGTTLSMLNIINQNMQDQLKENSVVIDNLVSDNKQTLGEVVEQTRESEVGETLKRIELITKNWTSKSIYENIINKTSNTLNQASKNIIANFIEAGTGTTLVLGQGERAGVINSFQSAFSKLPETEDDWNDIIKISNGRWPGQVNEESENNAKNAFKKIYLRDVDMNNPHDNAAVTIIAYGLRPKDRNLDSEKNAIKYFRAIYSYDPELAKDWDIIRAIAYSGAIR